MRVRVARGQHCVLGREPAFAATALPAGNAVLDRRGAEHARRAERDRGTILRRMARRRARTMIGRSSSTRAVLRAVFYFCSTAVLSMIAVVD